MTYWWQGGACWMHADWLPELCWLADCSMYTHVMQRAEALAGLIVHPKLPTQLQCIERGVAVVPIGTSACCWPIMG
jgi:hypothetical protein